MGRVPSSYSERCNHRTLVAHDSEAPEPFVKGYEVRAAGESDEDALSDVEDLLED